MRLALTFLFGMLLGACTAYQPHAAAQSPSDHSSSAAALQSMTIALFVDGAVCSGVWVSPRYVVTAKHCIESADVGEPVVFSVHEDLYPKGTHEETKTPYLRVAFISSVDDAHDLALLFALAPPEHLFATLHEGAIEQGMFAQSMGHPQALWYSYSTGTVSALRERSIGDEKKLWLQSTAPVSQGNSGGGLFDSQERLIGIADAIVQNGQSLNMFVPALYVEQFLIAHGVLQ